MNSISNRKAIHILVIGHRSSLLPGKIYDVPRRKLAYFLQNPFFRSLKIASGLLDNTNGIVVDLSNERYLFLSFVL